MQNKSYHLNEFFNPLDQRSLILDTSAGLSSGALPGLEQYLRAVAPLLPVVDGILTSPGQARHFAKRTRTDAAILVRADWTNALRSADFVLPHDFISYIPILDPSDALDMGAHAIVLDFLLGFEEHIEASCLRHAVQFALQGAQVGMPLLIDVQPVGPRVVLHNQAIALGVSYALEAGADGIAVPWPGADTFKMIHTMAAGAPVWLKPTSFKFVENELAEALSLGAAGLWVDQHLFLELDPIRTAVRLGELVHPTLVSADGMRR